MFRHLQIHEPRERLVVGLADAALGPLGWVRRHTPPRPTEVERVLLLRLERIGDLLMVLDAIDDARRVWPAAEIDLAVGSWNAPLAALIAGINRVEQADVPWLAREGQGQSWPDLVRVAREWRTRPYDVVVNFEPDIRSNALAWLSGAASRVGYSSGGGGSLLTSAEPYSPTEHVSINARRLVARASGVRPISIEGSRGRRLTPTDEAQAAARTLLGAALRPFVGVHVSGGRESKQWHLDRFAAAAGALAERHGATIVLTGSDGDRPMVDAVLERLANVPVVDAAGRLDLVELAALLGELDLLITGDTGPMHLAAVMDTPVVALFGPSDPRRYGPQAPRQQVLRIDLPCSPCGRVRLPPERCRGHVPDCLDGIAVDRVVSAASDILERRSAGADRP